MTSTSFPTSNSRRDCPLLPAAVLYNDKWYWAVEAIDEDNYICERHENNRTEEIELHFDEMQEFI